MDLLKNLLGDKTSDLVSGLVSKAGFSQDQAQAFVPEAASSVVDAVKGAGGGIDFSDMGSAAQTVMGKVDVPALAGKVGIGTEQVQNGLSAILPTLLNLFQEKAGGASGIMSMLGGLGEGGLGKIAGGLGKMFGK